MKSSYLAPALALALLTSGALAQAPTTNYRAVGARPGAAKWKWVQRIGGVGGDAVTTVDFAQGALFAGGVSESKVAKFGHITLEAPSEWTGRFDPKDGKPVWVTGTNHGAGITTIKADETGSLLSRGWFSVAKQSITDGSILWRRSAGMAEYETGLETGDAGSFYVTGGEWDRNPMVIKRSSDGTELWRCTTNLYGYVKTVHRGGDGNIYFGGHYLDSFGSSMTLTTTAGTSAVTAEKSYQMRGFVGAVSAEGEPLWVRAFWGPISSICDNGAGVCFVAVLRSQTAGAQIFRLATADGAVLGNIFTEPHAAPLSMVPLQGGDLAVLMPAGELTTNSLISLEGYVVARYDAEDTLQWILPVKGSALPESEFAGITASPDGQIFVGLTTGTRLSTQFAGHSTFASKGRDREGFIAAIGEAPSVVTPPAPQVLAVNAPLVLSIEATGLSGPVSYQWLKDGKALVGHTARTLNLPQVQLKDAGAYACRVSSGVGVAVSAPAAVQVVYTTSRTLKAPLGKALDLATLTAGKGLSFKWWRNEERLSNTGGFLNTTTGKLRITALTPSFTGAYTCEVSGLGGTVSVPFNAEVMQPPVFSVPTVPDAIVSGEFTLQLQASDAVSYQATALPAGLVLNPRTGLISGIPSAPGSRTITVSATNAAGVTDVLLSFDLTVHDIAGHAQGKFVGLIEGQPWNANLGGTLSLSLTATGSCTGSFKMAGATFALKGRVQAQAATRGWTFTQRLARSGKPALLVDLHSPSTVDGPMTGSIRLEATPDEAADIHSAGQVVWSSTRSASAFGGTVNAVCSLPSGLIGDPAVPQGANSLKTVVSAGTGAVALAANLGDGSAVSGSTVLLPAGEVPLWISLYGSTGSLTGTPILTVSEQSGTLSWTRNAKGNSATWPSAALTVTGTRVP
jgi:hypothetical protein